ncbi:MAG: M28 family peptidase [Saprospiraceae bacterium]|nr:M28 family peptidase [Saprospiraceae bacterium]
MSLKYSSTAVLLLLLFVLAGVLSVCKNEPSQDKPSVPSAPAVTPVAVPAFQADSAFLYVKKQVDFGPRVPNTDAHRRCGEWLAAELRRHGMAVIEQEFTAQHYKGTTFQCVNVIGQYKPELQRRILLAAHWDSRFIADQDTKDKNKAIPGADDGGSGVGVLLELARTLNANPVDIGVDIVFFDAEDQGNDSDDGQDHSRTWCLGSQHWAQNLHKPGYYPMYGILLDMVGAANPRFAKEGISRQAAPQIVDRVWNQADRLGYAHVFVNENGAAITDDHLFVIQLARIPMIDIINRPGQTTSGFVPHWHTHNDNMSAIDKNTLGMVGNVVTHCVYNTYNETF